MKLKWPILIATAAAAVIVAAWFLFGNYGEPRFQGRPVSYWFRVFYLNEAGRISDDGQPHDDPVQAFRAMGTNALPYLANQALDHWEYSSLHTNVHEFLNKLPESFRPEREITRPEIRRAAVDAIGILQLTAEVILPAVQPSLDSPDTNRQAGALEIMYEVHEQAFLLVPSFQKALGFAYPDARFMAVRALGNLGSNAAPALPQLQAAFAREPEGRRRPFFATALLQIDPQQAEAMAYLTNDLRAGSTLAAAALGRTGPNARPAVPNLLEALRAANTAGMYYSATFALTNLGVSPDVVLPVLREKVRSGPDQFRIELVNRIFMLSPADPAAISGLLDLVQRQTKFAPEAVNRLRDLGPAAKDAVPVLRQFQDSTNRLLRIAVIQALSSLAPNDPPK